MHMSAARHIRCVGFFVPPNRFLRCSLRAAYEPGRATGVVSCCGKRFVRPTRHGALGKVPGTRTESVMPGKASTPTSNTERCLRHEEKPRRAGRAPPLGEHACSEQKFWLEAVCGALSYVIVIAAAGRLSSGVWLLNGAYSSLVVSSKSMTQSIQLALPKSFVSNGPTPPPAFSSSHKGSLSNMPRSQATFFSLGLHWGHSWSFSAPSLLCCGWMVEGALLPICSWKGGGCSCCFSCCCHCCLLPLLVMFYCPFCGST